jgi:ATP-dependent DNA helicase RecG
LLHRIEFIEKAGSGITHIRDEAHDHGCPDPVFESNLLFTATFRPNPEVRALGSTSTVQVPHKHLPGTAQVRVLRALGDQPRSRDELQAVVGLVHRQHFFQAYLKPLLDAGLLEPTIPEKPRSSRQRYRLTRAGRQYLKKAEEPG